jgi:hypothetical protein
MRPTGEADVPAIGLLDPTGGMVFCRLPPPNGINHRLALLAARGEAPHKRHQRVVDGPEIHQEENLPAFHHPTRITEETRVALRASSRLPRT